MTPVPSPHPASPLPCPCGSLRPYAACCGRYHQGAAHDLAPTPEALMRSRYAAFVLDLRPYLWLTWQADHRPPAIEAPEPGLRWLGLKVVTCLPGSPEQPGDPDAGRVHFVARYKLQGRAHRLDEHSLFVREAGHWRYVRGLEGG